MSAEPAVVIISPYVNQTIVLSVFYCSVWQLVLNKLGGGGDAILSSSDSHGLNQEVSCTSCYVPLKVMSFSGLT